LKSVIMFSLKTYQTGKGKLVAACDDNLLGEEFTEEDVTLSVEESFYFEDKVEFETILEELKEAKIANLIGDKLIEKLKQKDKIEESEIKRVSGVPHTQIFVI